MLRGERCENGKKKKLLQCEGSNGLSNNSRIEEEDEEWRGGEKIVK